MNTWTVLFGSLLLLWAYDLFHTRFVADTTSGGKWFRRNNTPGKILVFGPILGSIAWAGWWNDNIGWLFYAAVAITASWLIYFGWALRDFKAPHLSVFGRRQARTPSKEGLNSVSGGVATG